MNNYLPQNRCYGSNQRGKNDEANHTVTFFIDIHSDYLVTST